ncbi:MAG: PEP-CTERM sorting domain-containing protein [Fimbriimonadaceae bacterium]|nr:PEP-CTERM sorting domain-containing protein [Fimbriimonadaceae bacterium]
MRTLSVALLLAAVAGAHAQSRSSFTNVGSLLDISVNNSGLSYNVGLTGSPTVAYAGVTYEIQYIIGFWVLSNTDISASNSASGAWSTNNNNAGSGGISGWTVSYQNSQRIDPTESKTFTYNQLNNVTNKQYGFYVRLGEDVHRKNGPHAGEKVYITGTTCVPEPTSMAALGLGAVALLRRRRQAK